MTTTRRGFLGRLLALAAAPAVAGFAPTAIAVAVAPGRYVSVVEFGAVNDGITDNTASFQRAIAAAGSGGTAFVPSGVYAIGSRINGRGVRLQGVR